jgi:hypothetical protein
MAYYPRFLSEIVKMPWDFRYDVLKEIHGDWKILSDEPIEDMMDYVFDKGYFGIFSRGVIVNEDGSFQLHNLISKNLGKTGIFHEQI